jgi:hypothetical protein
VTCFSPPKDSLRVCVADWHFIGAPFEAPSKLTQQSFMKQADVKHFMILGSGFM